MSVRISVNGTEQGGASEVEALSTLPQAVAPLGLPATFPWFRDTEYLATLTSAQPLSVPFNLASASGLPPMSGANLADGVLLAGLWYLPAGTYTGIQYALSVQGNFTADNNNRIGIYTVAGTTATLAKSTADNANLWKAAANTLTTENLSSNFVSTGEFVFVACLYNTSAQTTAPQLYGYSAYAAQTGGRDSLFYGIASPVVGSSKAIAFTKAAQADLPATIDLSALTFAECTASVQLPIGIVKA
jgi:hypothetical protein